MSRSQKADENLAAAELLATAQPNAAVSRAYYAVYLAVYDELVNRSEDPLPRNANGEKYWPHHRLADLMSENGLLNEEDLPMKVTLLCAARVRADYYPDSIGTDKSAEFVDSARLLVAHARGQMQ